MNTVFVGGIAIVGFVFLFAISVRNPLYLLLAHVTSRIILDSIPGIAYQSAFGGLSYMNLYSVAFIPLAVAIASHHGRSFRHIDNVPYLVLIAFAFITTVLQQSWAGFVEVGFKWLYLWAMAGLVCAAFQKNDESTVLLLLWVVLCYPMINQCYVALVGGPTITSGQISYSGSYFHNSDLGFLLLASVAIAFILLERLSGLVPRLLMGCGLACAHIGLFANNYRTTLVSLIVFWLWRVALLYRRGRTKERIWVLSSSSILLASLGFVVGAELFDRLGDLFELLRTPEKYLDFSGNASRAELMSGRVDLINAYMSHYLASPVEVWVLGIGPEEGTKVIGIYAHNEYVSALVEGGLLGLLALLFFLLRCYTLFSKQSRLSGKGDWVGIATFVGLAVAALGTMPFRNMRAMLLLGLLVGWATWRLQGTLKNSSLAGNKVKSNQRDTASTGERGPGVSVDSSMSSTGRG